MGRVVHIAEKRFQFTVLVGLSEEENCETLLYTKAWIWGVQKQAMTMLGRLTRLEIQRSGSGHK